MKTNLKVILIAAVLISSLFTGNTQAQRYWNLTSEFAGDSRSYIAVKNSTSININGSFTMEAWINPDSLLGLGKGIISKGGTLGGTAILGMRIVHPGIISLITNGGQRLQSRLSNRVPLNKWTHVSCTYNTSGTLFSIYINGLLDTSRSVAIATPVLNSDSLFIGIIGATGPFNGQIDEVRLWNRALTASEVSNYMRTSLGTSSGVYSGLVMSLPFQNENTLAGSFSTKDLSGNGNNGFERNVTGGGSFYSPIQTVSQNESIELDGTEDYLAGKDTVDLNPTTAVTLECWVYPRTLGPCRLLMKGNNYALIYSSQLRAMINGVVLSSGVTLPVNKWTHIGFTYESNGDYEFFINGVSVEVDFNDLGNITTTTDSIYIGGGPGTIGDFNGFMDEVRITNANKLRLDFYKFQYVSFESFNDPNLIDRNINYGFDGNTLDNIGNGGPRLFLRNNARFSHPGQIANQPVSPLNTSIDFKFSKGFYMKTSLATIPSTGEVKDSIIINSSAAISDINLFVALNHTRSSDLEILLVSPGGATVKVFDNNSTNSADNNVISIFNDEADSSMINGRYTSFHTFIRPFNSINSMFNGSNPQGYWKIIIRDEINNNSGTLYSWGIQLNNAETRDQHLNLTAIFQGFYNPATDAMIPDTMTVNLRGGTSPFTVLGTSKALLNNSGLGLFSFETTSFVHEQGKYRLEIRHRNSLETWNRSASVQFTNSEVNVSFAQNINSAFGNNLIKVDSLPVTFAVYGGDADQNGTVDLNDVLIVFNDANLFLIGYIISDLNGDNISDLSDLLLAHNNSVNFVSVKKP